MAISKTSPEALYDVIEQYDKFREEGANHDDAMTKVAAALDISPKTAKERFEAIHTTLEVWNAYEEGKISYTRLRLLGREKMQDHQINYLFRQVTAKDLGQKETQELRKQIMSGQVQAPKR